MRNYLLVLLLMLLMSSSCSLLKRGAMPDINLLKANNDVNALKNEVHGNIDIAPIKAPISASVEAQPVMGVGNDTTRVGGNYKEINIQKNDVALMRDIIGGLVAIVLALIGFITKQMFESSKQWALIMGFMNKQEATEARLLDIVVKAAIGKEEKHEG
jgi:hypothetical protein